MVNALLGMLTALVGWLVSHLPISPFQSLTLGFNGFAGSGITIDTMMGWLNWAVPFGDMLLLLQAWLTAALAVLAVKVLTKPVTSTVTTLSVA